ncbi:GDSL-type esterase/lipase family protein [Embleya hyalina]|uniref:Lysophospholipase n=1 Tax=Embleya hyalina TaxID=516124 RepID=A0A401YRQ7_9ACTN|nr:GDSL-type esterase/lipase family protein [Embleya hyalina]GCD97279.1 lysophospholipase [Embleya hyalina]
MEAAAPDLRICVAGDSFVQGVGDLSGGGWVGRLAAESRRRGRQVTAYNLGVRYETSADVAERWYGEAVPRMRHADGTGMVFAFGVNDVRVENGRPRVAHADSVANLDAILDTATGARWTCLVVGAPPVPGERDDGEAALALEDAYAKTCAARGIPFVPIQRALREDPQWWAGIEAYGDGAHCDAAGYAKLAALIADGGWWDWLDSLAPGH